MRQVGALPYRIDGNRPGSALQVLLVTTLRTRRWIIPKGNVDYHMSPHQAAAQEALEEGGVVGEIGHRPLGTFCYTKQIVSGALLSAKVVVFPLAVSSELDDWPEKDIRERRWFPIDEAAAAVVEPDLAAILRSFRPKDR